MTVKTEFTRDDFTAILSHYDLGEYVGSEAIAQGTVQTNYYLETTRGRYVFRYYEVRSRESVLFESELLKYLAQNGYPSPVQVRNRQGAYVGEYRGRPYAVYEYIPGQPLENPGPQHWQQLIQKAAELNSLGQGFNSEYTLHRWNYGPGLCRTLAREEAAQLDTPRAYQKLAWLDLQTDSL